MAEAVRDIPVIVGGLGRCDRYKTIYRMLGVAGHKNFRSGGDLMKEVVSKPKIACDNEWLSRRDDYQKATTPARDQ